MYRSVHSRKKSNLSRHIISWWLLSERQNWGYHQLGQKTYIFVETVYFAEILLFGLLHGLIWKSRILLILHWNQFAETSFETGRFEYSPDITSLASSKSSSVATFIFFMTGRFEYSLDITSLASSKSSSVAAFNKVVWGSIFRGIFCRDFDGFDMTVLLTPLDGKSATNRIEQFDKTFVKLTWRNSRRLGFILQFFFKLFI